MSALGERFPTNRSAETGFKLYQGYVIVVQGSVGNLRKLNFIIDTGAVPSVVDPRVARKLGLRGVSHTVSAFTKRVQTEQVNVPSIELGSVRVASVRVLVQDLSFIEKALGVRVDALIGLDVLGGNDFSIDYESERITFGMLMGPAKAAGAADRYVAFESEPGFAVVQIQIQQQAFRLMVDTGSSDLILFQPRIQGRLPSAHVTGVRTKTTMGGDEQLSVIELLAVRLGSADLVGQKADLMTGEAPASVNIDGVLGVTSLGVKRIAFDFENRIIRWEPR